MTEWISVDDSVPIGGSTVIVAVKLKRKSPNDYRVQTAVYMPKYNQNLQQKGVDWLEVGGMEGDRLHPLTSYVTHWMPLPEPPKPDS